MNQPEKIGKIEPETVKIPEWEEWEANLGKFIADSEELRARIESLKNPQLTEEGFYKMISSWNEEHRKWAGGYIEKGFTGPGGHVLKVRMDHRGNVQLGGEIRH